MSWGLQEENTSQPHVTYLCVLYTHNFGSSHRGKIRENQVKLMFHPILLFAYFRYRLMRILPNILHFFFPESIGLFVNSHTAAAAHLILVNKVRSRSPPLFSFFTAPHSAMHVPQCFPFLGHRPMKVDMEKQHGEATVCSSDGFSLRLVAYLVTPGNYL